MVEYPQRRYRNRSVVCALLLVAGIVASLYPDAASALRKTSANRECSICHIMWLDEFKRKDVTPLIPFEPLPETESGKEDVVSTERMCFSCHDGFVLDSRALWKKERHNHPVGVKPSADVTIPTAEGKTVFPLNQDGNLYCGSCHTAHAQDWDQKNTTLFMRMDNKNSSMCTACHLNRVTGPEKGNHPIHERPREEPPALLKAGSKFSDKGEIICQTCHLAHGSEQRTMLASSISDSALCSSCHSRGAKVRNTRHDMRIMDPAARNGRGQLAGESGPCSACHIPHRAQGPKLWSRRVPANLDPANAYCLDCHRRDGIAHRKRPGENSHPVNVALKKVGINATRDGWKRNAGTRPASAKLIELPLFDQRGGPVEQGGNVTCLSCHDPHLWSADHAAPPAGDVREIEGDGANSFLRIANTDSQLCVNCHLNQAPVRASKHDMSVMAPKSKNSGQQVAGNSGPCSACHMPHQAQGPNLWSRPLELERDRSGAYCLGCHRKGGVARKKDIGANSHPLNVSLKSLGIKAGKGKWTTRVNNRAAPGRMVELPLFDDRGREVEQGGKVSCQSCHDPHLWSPDHARPAKGDPRKLEGDGRNSFLRIANDGDSALCVNCHRAQSPVSYSKHNLALTAPGEKNHFGQRPSSSGVCSACHVAHNGSGNNLSARKPGSSGKGVMPVCLDCHSGGGVAEDKTAGEISHPLHVSLKTPAAAADLPLFDRDGRRNDRRGLVDCATCHDPHQWDPADAVAQSGTNPDSDGDANTSFLRLAAGGSARLCAGCHENKSTVIGTDHDLSVSAPDARNARGRSARQTGACGQCHSVHGARLQYRLWARPPGESDQVAQMLCTGCHSSGGVARDKVPLELEHPPRKLAAGEARLRPADSRRVMPPLFDAVGESGQVGMISCATCHDPHVWDAAKPQKGAGKNIEGDVRNSFLRHSSTEYFICADCHAGESLYRYKYFHWPKSRSKETPDDF